MAATLQAVTWCSWLFAMLLCLVLVRGVLHKLGDFPQFVADLGNYRLLPETWAKPVAMLCSILEVACMVMLCIAPLRVAGAVLALGVLAIYTLAIALNLWRGRRSIDCGCGGGGQGISWLHVLRNAGYAALCLPVIMGGAEAPGGAAVKYAGLACVLALWLAVLLFEQLLGNRMHAQATTHSRL